MKAAEKALSHEDSINVIIRLLHQAALKAQGPSGGIPNLCCLWQFQQQLPPELGVNKGFITCYQNGAHGYVITLIPVL